MKKIKENQRKQHENEVNTLKTAAQTLIAELRSRLCSEENIKKRVDSAFGEGSYKKWA